jgi:TPP-dependent pyruvate/acetoin dehydrogenase alpha subunit
MTFTAVLENIARSTIATKIGEKLKTAKSISLSGLSRLGKGLISTHLCQQQTKPLLIVTATVEEATREVRLSGRGVGFGILSLRVDGMDPIQVEAATRCAVSSIRAGNGPYFLECRTYRFRAHSMFDAQLYRTREEIAVWKARDPIPRLRRWLLEAHMITQADIAELEAAIAAEIDAAVAFAEAGTWEDVADLERFVLMDDVPR